jgi:hypothetical protein
LLRLGKTEATIERNASLLMPNGGDLDNSVVLGRGQILHVLVDDVWYQYSTASLP